MKVVPMHNSRYPPPVPTPDDLINNSQSDHDMAGLFLPFILKAKRVKTLL